MIAKVLLGVDFNDSVVARIEQETEVTFVVLQWKERESLVDAICFHDECKTEDSLTD